MGNKQEIDTPLFGCVRRFSFTCTLILACAMCGCAAATRQSLVGVCPDNLGSAIKNFCVVTPNVLWRGGRPDQDGVAWLIQHGVRTIVNLELILDDKRIFDQVIVRDTKSYEVGYFRIHDWEPLRMLAPEVVDDHVAHFLAIVSQQPKPIYVHCRYGENRTGVMVAAYRMILEGAGVEEAIVEMRPYQGLWLKADESYIRGLVPERREEIRRNIAEWEQKLQMDAKVVCTNGICAVVDY